MPCANPPLPTGFTVVATSSYAPAAVHLDASDLPLTAGTAQSGTYRHQTGPTYLYGFCAAYVVDVPGPWSSSSTVTDESGVTQEVATLLNFAIDTRPTVYVSAAGSDANNGATTGASVLTLARAQALSVGPTRILLNRGDVFVGPLLLATVDCYVGAYGVGVKPVIRIPSSVPYNTTGGQKYVVSVLASRVMIRDVQIERETASPFLTGWSGIRVTVDDVTLSRVTFGVIDDGISATDVNRLLVDQCGTLSASTLRSALVRASGRQIVVTGCTASESSDGQIIVFPMVNRGLIAGCTLADSNAQSIRVVNGTKIAISGNALGARVALGRGTNANALQDVILEGNTYSGTAQVLIGPCVTRMFARNERFDLTNTAAFIFDGRDAAGHTPTSVSLAFNTVRIAGTKGAFAVVRGIIADVDIVANILVAPDLDATNPETASLWLGGIGSTVVTFNASQDNLFAAPARLADGPVFLGTHWITQTSWLAQLGVQRDAFRNLILKADLRPYSDQGAGSALPFAGVRWDAERNPRSGANWTAGALPASSDKAPGVVVVVPPIVVDPPAPPPVPAFSVSGTQGMTPFPVFVDASILVGGAGTKDVTIDFGDGTAPYNSVSTAWASHVYWTVGEYTCTVTYQGPTDTAPTVETGLIRVLDDTRRKLYASATGSTSTDGLSEANAVTLARALTLLDDDDALLLKGGDTFDVGTSLTIAPAGVLLSSYGTLSVPTLHWTSTTAPATGVIIVTGAGFVCSKAVFTTAATAGVVLALQGDLAAIVETSTVGMTCATIALAVRAHIQSVTVANTITPGFIALDIGPAFLTVLECSTEAINVSVPSILVRDCKTAWIHANETSSDIVVQNGVKVWVSANACPTLSIAPVDGSTGKVSNGVIERNLSSGRLIVGGRIDNVIVRNNIASRSISGEVVRLGAASGTQPTGLHFLNNTVKSTDSAAIAVKVLSGTGISAGAITVANTLYVNPAQVVASASPIVLIPQSLAGLSFSGNVWCAPAAGVNRMLRGATLLTEADWQAATSSADAFGNATLDVNSRPSIANAAAYNGLASARVQRDLTGFRRWLASPWTCGAAQNLQQVQVPPTPPPPDPLDPDPPTPVLNLVTEIVRPVLADYYVSTTGNDSNPGTLGSPFRTIGKAATVATAGKKVRIMPGQYREAIAHVNSGTATAPILFYAAAGDNVFVKGSVSVTGWTLHTGSIYKAAWAYDFWYGPQSNNLRYFETSGRKLYAESFFFNTLKLRRASSLATLVAGNFWIDYAADLVYVCTADSVNPTTGLLEGAAVPCVCQPRYDDASKAQYVQWVGVTFQHAANFAGTHFAMVRMGKYWAVQDCSALQATATGICHRGGNSTLLRVKGNFNGQCGIGGGNCTELIEQDCETQANNPDSEYPDLYECGGGKYARVEDVTILRRASYENHGPGLWFDIDCKRCNILQCVVHDNTQGIFACEISQGPFLIEGNECYDNRLDNGDNQDNYVLSESWHVVMRNNICRNGFIALRDNVRTENNMYFFDVQITGNTIDNGKIRTFSGQWNPYITGHAGDCLGQNGQPKKLLIDGNIYHNSTEKIRWQGVHFNDLATIRTNLGFEATGSVT